MCITVSVAWRVFHTSLTQDLCLSYSSEINGFDKENKCYSIENKKRHIRGKPD